MPSGSTMTGPQAEYLRPVAPIRQVARLNAIQRPTFTLVQKDSTGKQLDPAKLLADRVSVVDDTVYYAGGNVDITRPDLHATSDSAYMNETRQYGRLLKRPQIEGRGEKQERQFTLRGKAIDLFSKNRLLERVLSVDSAQAVSGDLDLKSDSIDLRITDNKLSRAQSWGPTGARAVSPDQTITLTRSTCSCRTSTSARCTRSTAPSPKPSRIRRSSSRSEKDWLRGDTILATFDTALTADTSSKPRIRELARDRKRQLLLPDPVQQRGDRAAEPQLRSRTRHYRELLRSRKCSRSSLKSRPLVSLLEPSTDSTATKQKPRTAPRTLTRPGGRSPIRPSGQR